MDPGHALARNGKEVVGQNWYDSMEIVGHLHAVGRVRCAVSAVLKARGVPAPAGCWLLVAVAGCAVAGIWCCWCIQREEGHVMGRHIGLIEEDSREWRVQRESGLVVS